MNRHETHANGWAPAVHMSRKSHNVRLFHYGIYPFITDVVFCSCSHRIGGPSARPAPHRAAPRAEESAVVTNQFVHTYILLSQTRGISEATPKTHSYIEHDSSADKDCSLLFGSSAGRGGRKVSHRPRIHEQKNSTVSNGLIRYVKQLGLNGWEPAVYMSCMSQNFRLLHVSN